MSTQAALTEAETAEIKTWLASQRRVPPPHSLQYPDGTWNFDRIRAMHGGDYPRGIPIICDPGRSNPRPLLDEKERAEYFAKVDAEAVEKNRRLETETLAFKKRREAEDMARAFPRFF